MRKVITKREHVQASGPSGQNWIGTDLISTVQVSSEDPATPVENIFDPENEIGWRAGEPGEQRIRITFHKPVHLRRIQLEFVERREERTHEFVLRWAENPDGELTEIVRQRWNFSPRGSTREYEDYNVSLDHVEVLELVINPNISRPDAIASVAHLRIG
jgi:hypothetical protein